MKRAMLWSMVGLLTCSGWAQAQLKWEKTEAEVTGTLNDKELKAEYAFSNAGSYPVTVKEVKPNCDCTIGYLEKKTYAPGESGKLAITLKVGQSQGEQNKTIEVLKDDAKVPKQTLRLKAHLPEVLKIEPRALFWKKGEKAEAKTLKIQVVYEKPVKILGVKAGKLPVVSAGTLPPGVAALPKIEVQADVKEINAGRVYQLTIRPQDTSKEGLAMLEVETDLPGAWRIQRVYVQVMDPEATRQRMLAQMHAMQEQSEATVATQPSRQK